VKVIDSSADVGSQLSIAVDNTGKVAIGYYDKTNSAVKFAITTNGTNWNKRTVDSSKQVGTSPSVAFDIDGNVYLAYYRRTSGDVILAAMNRDSGAWTRTTVDGTDGTDVGADLSLDVGEAAVSTGFFTQYDTTVAIAYSDSTNGDLKYARLDLDDSTATWFIATVDNTSGVANIDLNLHAGTQVNGLQAQIAYQDVSAHSVKYAYRNGDWFTETAASGGNLGQQVQLSFDADNNPMVTYFNNSRKATYTATRSSSGTWSSTLDGASFSVVSVAQNERSGESVLSYLNRAKTDVFSDELL